MLDAITFALYGPGERGGDGRLHSHFAEPWVEPEVELEFSLRGTRHRVTRSPEHHRPKRRGDGMTTQHARVHLERFEDDRWVSRSSNKAEVGEILADELGLTRDQFTQVVLLPQGEFMRFLRADDDDRRVLLTKLFGTELYDRITHELDRRRKVADQDVEAADRRLRAALAAAAEAAHVDGAERDTLLGSERAAQHAGLDAIDARLTAAAAVASAGLVSSAARFDEQQERCSEAALAADRAGRFLAASAAVAAHEQGSAEHALLAARLADAESTEPIRPLLAAVSDAQQAVAVAVRGLTRITAEPTDEWQQGGGAAELEEVAAQGNRGAAELTHLVAREGEHAALHAHAQQLHADAAEAGALAATLSARAAELPQLRRAAAGRLAAARESAATVDALQARRTALESQLAAAQELERVRAERGTVAVRQDAAFAHYVAAVDEHQRLVDARLANMAAELAGELADGAPCAVCGSVEHPRPARPNADAVTAADVSAAAQARRAAEHERDDRTAELAELDRLAAVLTVRAAGADSEELAGTRTAIAAAQSAAAAVPDLAEQVRQLEAEGDQLATDLAAADRTAAKAAAAAAQAELAATALAAELAAAADGHPSVRARQEALTHGAEVAARLAAAVRAVAAARTACAVAVERAAAEARDRGFADLAAAQAGRARCRRARPAALGSRTPSGRGRPAARRAGSRRHGRLGRSRRRSSPSLPLPASGPNSPLPRRPSALRPPPPIAPATSRPGSRPPAATSTTPARTSTGCRPRPRRSSTWPSSPAAWPACVG